MNNLIHLLNTRINELEAHIEKLRASDSNYHKSFINYLERTLVVNKEMRKRLTK